jgi:hypothetical protein
MKEKIETLTPGQSTYRSVASRLHNGSNNKKDRLEMYKVIVEEAEVCNLSNSLDFFLIEYWE